MNLSTRAKVLVAIGLVVASAIWLALLDYGLNAGRIHYGVHVNGIDVGGLVVEEARDELDRHAQRYLEEPVVLTAEGMECSFQPRALGWRPRSMKTAQVARSVGFRGDLSNALAERVKAWFTGVEISWVGEPKPRKVSALVDDCETQAEALQLTLDRARLRTLITEAIVTWPRTNFEVPVTPSG